MLRLPPKEFCRKRYSYLQVYEKETPTQVFFCEYCKIFKNIHFEEHMRMDAFIIFIDGNISWKFEQRLIARVPNEQI